MAINSKDMDAFSAVLAQDCAWVLPTNDANPLLGTKSGRDAILERLDTLQKAKLNLFVDNVCINFKGDIALIFHNWGIRGDKRMDERLVSFLTVNEHGLVTRIESYLSDIDALFNFTS